VALRFGAGDCFQPALQGSDGVARAPELAQYFIVRP
jgi:hypothetical protein